ncbi:MAG: deoxyribodipyrimidine photo-lyase [Enterobacteriaceae bacterium]
MAIDAAQKKRHLVWLRMDLRIADNMALSEACADPLAQVSVIYIATPQQWKQHAMSPRQAGLIYHALLGLRQALQQRGIEFIYQQCDDFTQAAAWLVNYCRQHQVDSLFYNCQYEWNEWQRDRWVDHQLERETAVYRYDDSLLLPPGSVLTQTGTMFSVYSPFYRAVMHKLLSADSRCRPAPAPRGEPLPLSRDDLHPFDYPRQEQTLFVTSEEQAGLRLQEFCQHTVAHYHQQRDFPALPATSLLSACLAIGLLSVRQCLNCLLLNHPDVLQQMAGGASSWLNEIIWREFYRHLLVARPELARHQPFHHWGQYLQWSDNKEHFQAWQQGRTGYPIVDAAMRQLAATGWMHNRLRMITASFLVKDLHLNWRWGEHYFMSQLTDGDLAANNGGWQWAASTGADAAPYFRIFNPSRQGEKFDPCGTFIRQWLPELTEVPDKWIHQPWQWANLQQKTLSYPLPIVDHGTERKLTLTLFANAKNMATQYKPAAIPAYSEYETVQSRRRTR